MKEEDRKYEEWLNEVRGKQPVLTDPDRLTAQIMQRVSGIKRPKNRLYLFAGWVSGIAATVLLCLLLTETMRMPAQSDYDSPGFIWESETASTLPPNWKSMTLTEKRSFLSTRQKQQERQKKLILQSIEKKLIKGALK